MSWPADGALGLAAGYLVKTTVVLTLALLAALAAKGRPAAFRHFILSSALLGLLLLPVLSLVPGGLRSPLLPSWMAASAGGAGPSGAAVGIKPVDTKPLAAVPGSRRMTGNGGRGMEAGGAAVALDPQGPGVGAVAAQGGTAVSKVRGPVAASSRPHGPDVRPGRWGLAVAVLWASGAAALLFRLLWGLAGAVRLTAQGRSLDSVSWRLLLDRFLALVSLRRPVGLKSHPDVLVPLTWGWRRPVVLLPEGADAWTEDERSSALFHELSHVKRADYLVMLLVRTSLALFWWNPLAWVVHRELRKEQEIACDELVLRAGIRPSTYAATLLAFRRSAGLRWNPSAALLGLLGRSSFQDRLAAILKQKLTFMEVKMKTKIMVGLALFAAVALIGTARPAARPEAAGPTTTVLAETALPGQGPAAALLAEPAGAQEKVKEQEKARAAEKAKEAAKAEQAKESERTATAKTVVIKPVVVEGRPIEVVIIEGGQAKTLVLEKPLTITKSKDGKTLVLTVEGKDIKVLEGEPLHLEIKGGEATVVAAGKPATEAEAVKVQIAKEIGAGGGQVIVFEGAEGKPVKIVKEIKAGKDAVTVVVEPRKAGESEIAWTVKEGDKPGALWIAKEHASRPEEIVWSAKDGKAFAFSMASDKAMLEKVRALQEQVEAIKAKKMDITALEDSLKKLEEELQAKAKGLETLRFKTFMDHGELTALKEFPPDKAKGSTFVWSTSKDGAVAKAKVFVGKDDKSALAIHMVFTGPEGEAGKAAFERAAARLKRDLPEGFTIVEQGYDPDDGTMTFKIAGPEGRKIDESLVKKFVEIVQSEIKNK